MNINLTILGQAISFLLFVIFCMRYIWPPITTALRERQQKISESLDAADQATHDLQLAKEKSDQILRESKVQATEIIDQANKRANQIVEEAKEASILEGQRLKAVAQTEIEQEVNRAKEELRVQLASLVIIGTEKILAKSIDRGSHNELVNKLAADL